MRYISGMELGGLTLRSPGADDAAEMIECMRMIYDETSYLSRASDEFSLTIEQEREFLTSCERAERNCMIGAWRDGALLGSVSVMQVSALRRMRHRATLGISVRRAYWGQGVGTRLMQAALDAAASAGFAQVELSVVSENARAIALYERFGFEKYGVLPRALRVDGRWMDEILMCRTLG